MPVFSSNLLLSSSGLFRCFQAPSLFQAIREGFPTMPLSVYLPKMLGFAIIMPLDIQNQNRMVNIALCYNTSQRDRPVAIWRTSFDSLLICTCDYHLQQEVSEHLENCESAHQIGYKLSFTSRGSLSSLIYVPVEIFHLYLSGGSQYLLSIFLLLKTFSSWVYWRPAIVEYCVRWTVLICPDLIRCTKPYYYFNN